MVRAALLSLAILASAAVSALADIRVNHGWGSSSSVYVRGHTRSSGTYVEPYRRTPPDGSFSNNWSSYPNVNPYTGKTGTRYYPSYRPSSRYGRW